MLFGIAAFAFNQSTADASAGKQIKNKYVVSLQDTVPGQTMPGQQPTTDPAQDTVPGQTMPGNQPGDQPAQDTSRVDSVERPTSPMNQDTGTTKAKKAKAKRSK